MSFAFIHFTQVAFVFMRMGVNFCVAPSAHDVFLDNGALLKKVASHPKCKFVTYQSYYHLKKYKEWGIPKPKVYYPIPIRISLFNRVSPFGERIIAGGRLIPKKGLDRLSTVKELTIFGEGSLMNKLKEKLPNAAFVGYLNGNELKQLMEESWLFLCPSIVTDNNDSEGIPNILKEACLMQLQCIASSVAGIPELSGIHLLDDWSEESINDMIDSIPKEPNVIGEKYVRNLYNPKNCVDKLLSAISLYIE